MCSVVVLSRTSRLTESTNQQSQLAMRQLGCEESCEIKDSIIQVEKITKMGTTEMTENNGNGTDNKSSILTAADEDDINIFLIGKDVVKQSSDSDLIEISAVNKKISLDPTNSSALFEFTLENVGRLQKQIITTPISLVSYNWTVLITPWAVQDTGSCNASKSRSVSLGLYLQCFDFGAFRRKKDRASREMTRCDFKATIKVLSKKVKTQPPLMKEIIGRFDCNSISMKYGFPSFVAFSDLTDKTSGYLKGNSVTLEVDLRISEITKSSLPATVELIGAGKSGEDSTYAGAREQVSETIPCDGEDGKILEYQQQMENLRLQQKVFEKEIMELVDICQCKTSYDEAKLYFMNNFPCDPTDPHLTRYDTDLLAKSMHESRISTIKELHFNKHKHKFEDVDVKILRMLINKKYLKSENLTSCRLVCKGWKTFLDPFLKFGVLLCDSSISTLSTLEHNISNMAAFDLKQHVVEKSIPFKKNITTLSIDQNPPTIGSIPMISRKSISSSATLHKKIATVTSANILKLLKLCPNLEELICNGTEIRCQEEMIERDRFKSIRLDKLTSLRVSKNLTYADCTDINSSGSRGIYFLLTWGIQAEVSVADFKSYFGGILGMKFPSLKSIEFKFVMNANEISCCDTTLIYAFLCAHKTSLRAVGLIAPPLAKAVQRASKIQRKQKSSAFTSLKDTTVSEFEFKDLVIEDLRFCLTLPNSSSKIEYNERKLEVKLLTSLTKLKKLMLSGFEPSDVTTVMKRNKSTLEVLHIKDSPGYLGRDKKTSKYNSRELNASMFENCRKLKQLIIEDFRLANPESLQTLPESTFEEITLISFMHPNKFHDSKFFNMLAESYFFPRGLDLADKHLAVQVNIQSENSYLTSEEILTSNPIHQDEPRTSFKSLSELQELPGMIEKHFHKHRIIEEELKVVIKFKLYTSTTCSVCGVKNCEGDKSCSKLSKLQKEQTPIQKTWLTTMPRKVQTLIFKELSLPCKMNCRLVCKEWKKIFEHQLKFGFWLNDGTASWVQDTTVHLSHLAVSDLGRPLDYSKAQFLSQVCMLVLECSKNTFLDRKDDMPIRNSQIIRHLLTHTYDPCSLFLSRESSSIEEKNIKWILEHAKNVVSLVFNNYALNNLQSSVDKNLKLIERNSFNNLYCLSISVSGLEIYVLEKLLAYNFPKLTNFCVRYYFLNRAHTLKQYECMFRFICNHKTLRILEIFDPPLPPPKKALMMLQSQSIINSETDDQNCTCPFDKCFIGPNEGFGTRKTITTKTTTSRNSKTVVQTTTITTTTQSPTSTEESQEAPNDCLICAACDCKMRKEMKSRTIHEEKVSKKQLLEMLNEVTQLTDLKITFRTSTSSKWDLGVHLMKQQQKLEEFHVEGVELSTCLQIIKNNARTLKVLHIYSPLLVPSVTLSADPGSNMFHCEDLKRCYKLTYLAIHSFQYFTTRFTKFLPAVPNMIRILELTLGLDISYEQYLEVLPSKVNNLEILYLKTIRAIKSGLLMSFILDCRKLKKIFLSKINEDVLLVLKGTPSIYINHCFGNDALLEPNPTPNEDGTFPRFVINRKLVETEVQMKIKSIIVPDGYGKKCCPVVPQFPILFIYLGPFFNRSEMKHQKYGEERSPPSPSTTQINTPTELEKSELPEPEEDSSEPSNWDWSDRPSGSEDSSDRLLKLEESSDKTTMAYYTSDVNG